jgi:DNA-binding winged helix-turn-helix (wHTH) protein
MHLPIEAVRLAAGVHPSTAGWILVVAQDALGGAKLAHHLHELALIPVVAFTAPQAIRCLGAHRFDLVVVHSGRSGAPNTGMAPLLAALEARRELAVVVVSDTDLDVGGWPSLPASSPSDATDGNVDPAFGCRRMKGPTLEWGGLLLDIGKRQAYWHGTPIAVTPIQLRMLAILVQAGGNVVTADTLSAAVWGADVFEDYPRVFAHIRRIRKRIEADPAHPTFLLTVRGEGFRLADI